MRGERQGGNHFDEQRLDRRDLPLKPSLRLSGSFGPRSHRNGWGYAAVEPFPTYAFDRRSISKKYAWMRESPVSSG